MTARIGAFPTMLTGLLTGAAGFAGLALATASTPYPLVAAEYRERSERARAQARRHQRGDDWYKPPPGSGAPLARESQDPVERGAQHRTGIHALQYVRVRVIVSA